MAAMPRRRNSWRLRVHTLDKRYTLGAKPNLPVVCLFTDAALFMSE
jgi:hypothetical protein